MHASHLYESFERPHQDRVIRNVKKLLVQQNIKFDGFVVCGISGIVMGSILARSLKKDLVIVRSTNDCHSPSMVENYKTSRRYIFLDDFICSGATFRKVKKHCDNYFDRVKNGNNDYNIVYPFDKKFDKKSKIIGQLTYSGIAEYKILIKN
jgi:orotate phosphoribosyltransferase